MQKREMLRAAIGFVAYLFFLPGIMFIIAGTARWSMAWVYVGLLLVSTVGSRLIVFKRNPDLLIERARFTLSEGTKPWDRLLVGVVAFYGPLAGLIVAGLDHRFGWPLAVPAPVQYLAALLVAAGYGLAVWAMVVNRYFSVVVRIQHDRGQVVVDSGPYRFMRHPAYAGGLLSSLALPFMLDALWALIPALVTMVALIIRTRLEDQTLVNELPEYMEYTRKTRSRLIPGIW